MERLFLIDGSSLLSTSFFGNVPSDYYSKDEEKKKKAIEKIMRTSTGLYTNGVYTMTKVLLKLIEKHKPTHLAVAWDVSRNTFRREMYEGYKAHRAETGHELGSQFGLMQSVLDAMNIKQFKMNEFEADDIIGTLSKTLENQVMVTVLTKDQDSLQLISDNTRVWLNTSKTKEYVETLGMKTKEYNVLDGYFEFTPYTFEMVYDIKPIQMIDKKALEGDTSDNIPGVKGVGEKAAVPLIKEFGTIEAIYDRIEDMDKEDEDEFKALMKSLGVPTAALGKLLKESETELVGKKAAFLSKELATIHTSIPEIQSIPLNELTLNIDEVKMKEKFAELEFKSLLE